MAVHYFTKTVLFLTVCLLHDTRAAISPSDTTYTAIADKNYTIPWQYDSPGDMDQVFWTFKSSAGATAATIMTRDNGSPAQVFDFNVEHVDNGNITLINVQMNNSGIYFCQVTYSFLSGIPTVTGTATLSVTQATTTTSPTTKPATAPTTKPTTAPTTKPATSPTTKPATAPMTKPATSPSTKPATAPMTKPATAPITKPATSPMTKPATTTTTSTTTTSSPTTTTPVTTPSTTSSSDKIIIVIVVVPVGVIAIVGTIIFFCFFYRLRRGERKPTSHKRHKQGKHYKDDKRQVQQHQQQPYILYGRGLTRESNHKETKRSRSLHNDRYNLYDGYHWGSQVKQNPMYKGDRNHGRLYNNETLPRYDGYRSGYTTGHVYPSHTSGYHYRPDYHGDSRGQGSRQYSSYPIYSRQQEYIYPSYSYMGY